MPLISPAARRAAFVRLHWPLLVCVLLVVSAVLFIRTVLGFEFPIPWNDETAFIAQAYEFSRTGSFYVYGLNSERVVMWMPPGYMLLLAGVYKVFGYSFEISRWVSCLLYLGAFGVAIAILRAALVGWRQAIGLALMLVAFLSPYSLAISNIARMESLYALIFLLSLLASLRGQYALGLALVVLGATVHYNAVYFLLPYAVLVGWKILRRESLTIGPGELLALVIAALAIAGYGLFVVKHIDGFWQDMRFQFAYKLGSPVMGGRDGWTLLGATLSIPFLQLMLHRRMGAEVFLSLYGTAFIAMALNGHNMWYSFAYNFGFWLLFMSVLASTCALSRSGSQALFVLIGVVLLYPFAQHFNSGTPPLDALKPRMSTLSRDFLPASEIERVRTFIAGLPANSTVSFGYTGVEPYFFADFAESNSRWSISGHSVTQVFPPRMLDHRVFCDSAMFPAYLAMYDWDGYPRKGQDTGCQIISLKK